MGPVKKYNVTIFLASKEKVFFALTERDIAALEKRAE